MEKRLDLVKIMLKIFRIESSSWSTNVVYDLAEDKNHDGYQNPITDGSQETQSHQQLVNTNSMHENGAERSLLFFHPGSCFLSLHFSVQVWPSLQLLTFSFKSFTSSAFPFKLNQQFGKLCSALSIYFWGFGFRWWIRSIALLAIWHYIVRNLKTRAGVI